MTDDGIPDCIRRDANNKAPFMETKPYACGCPVNWHLNSAPCVSPTKQEPFPWSKE